MAKNEKKAVSKVVKLSKTKILSLSEDERKKYFDSQLEELRKEEKIIKQEINLRQNAEKTKNRSKVNHAKYIIAGELLDSPEGKAFLEKLSKTKKYQARSALGLNLLMAELGFDITFQELDTDKPKTVNPASVEPVKNEPHRTSLFGK